MITPIVSSPGVFEGTWEEILLQGENWSGHRVCVLVFANGNPDEGRGIVAPQTGSGRFEEIMNLVQTFSPEEDEESLLDVIQENRAVRRQLCC